MLELAFIIGFVSLLILVNSSKHVENEIDLKQKLLSDACWFTEDYATYQLIIDLANGKNVDSAREVWRKNRLQ